MRLVLTDLLLAVTDKEIQVIAREVVTSMQDESVQEEGRKPTTPKTTKAITGTILFGIRYLRLNHSLRSSTVCHIIII